MPFSGYLEFLARQRRFVAFGFVMAFASSFGQTYFIGIFGPGIQAEFDLSHTLWGAIYMVGTIASALLLPWSGRRIDTLDLRTYTLIVCLLLVASCAFVSLVGGAVSLALAVFLLRQSGQGLMSHIAVTSMARYYEAERGRAIAVAAVGFAAGEALLPFLAVAAITAIGWRWTYASVALLLALGLLPLVLWLIRGHAERHRVYLERAAEPQAAGAGQRSWTRAEVLRDPRFFLLLPGVLAPSLVLTAMFFHHLNLADAKGWSHAWITGSYVIYALATTLTSLAAGTLIDRFGAARLVPFMLLPLAAALLLVGVLDARWAVWPYFVLAGVSVGIAHTAVSALWAEIYGVAHLGAVKSLVTALSVFASALGPVSMGGLVDAGLAIDAVCVIFAAYALVGAGLLRLALRDIHLFRRKR